jgi:hypothetical protein
MASCHKDTNRDLCPHCPGNTPADTIRTINTCDTLTVIVNNTIINTDTLIQGTTTSIRRDTIFQTVKVFTAKCTGQTWTTTTNTPGGSSTTPGNTGGGTDITNGVDCEWHLVSNPCTGGCTVDQYNPLYTQIVEEKATGWYNGFINAWTRTGRTLPGVMLTQNVVNQITAANFAQYGRATVYFSAQSSTNNNAWIIDNVVSPRVQ